MILRHHRNHPFSWLFDVVETVPLEPSVTQSRVVLQDNHTHEENHIHQNCQGQLVASAGPIHRHSPLLWNFPAYSSISKHSQALSCLLDSRAAREEGQRTQQIIISTKSTIFIR